MNIPSEDMRNYILNTKEKIFKEREALTKTNDTKSITRRIQLTGKQEFFNEFLGFINQYR